MPIPNSARTAARTTSISSVSKTPATGTEYLRLSAMNREVVKVGQLEIRYLVEGSNEAGLAYSR